MNIAFLSILLLAGPASDMDRITSRRVRVQVVARAQIISGESIAFDRPSPHKSKEQTTVKSDVVHLPLARFIQDQSNDDQQIISIQEFY